MRFNAALARRVALILGLSFPTFCNALADGRAVLPPKWMVDAYLSDDLMKPSRDDIARAIIPGLGMVPAFVGSRIYVTETVQSLPAMTSDTTPSGHVVSASGFYTTGDLRPWKAFDQDKTASSRWAANSSSTNHWIQRQTPTPIRVARYLITANVAIGTTGQAPTQWVFAGSNDGSSWTTLDSRSGQSWVAPPAGETKTFTITEGDRGHFLYHRFSFPLTNWNTMQEIEFLQDL